MLSRTALGTDEGSNCLKQDTAEGSMRAMTTLSCQSVPVPQHARLATTVLVKQRGRRPFFFFFFLGGGGIYIHTHSFSLFLSPSSL